MTAFIGHHKEKDKKIQNNKSECEFTIATN